MKDDSTAQHIDSFDGTRIFYEARGPKGAPGILLCDGIGCDGFVWKYLQPWLAERFRVVHAHYRGHGDSGSSKAGRYGIDAVVQDLLCVLDHAEVETATLIGHSMGVQVSIETALQAPDRVTGLALLCGSFGRPLDTFHDHALLKVALPVATRAVDRFNHLLRPVVKRLMPTDIGWTIARLTEVDGRMLKREDFIPYLEHLAKMDARIFVRMLAEAARHSTEDRLHRVHQAALIVGGEKDRFTPYWVSEVLGERLALSELHMVKGGTHTAPLEHRRLMELLLDDWFERHSLSPAAAQLTTRRRTASPTA